MKSPPTLMLLLLLCSCLLLLLCDRYVVASPAHSQLPFQRPPPTQSTILRFDFLPLRTQSRWIVDTRGIRVKWTCVNWAAHMETMLPEGLAQRSMDRTVELIRELGFNCVRFPFASMMFAMPNRTIADLMREHMSEESQRSFWSLNPSFQPNTTVVQVLDRTMDALQKHGLMVILDNHMTIAGWCCGLNDGNRWWNQKHFNVQDWLQTLERAARYTLKYRHIVGLGLRNEVQTLNPLQRGQWIRYMRQGASIVHKTNPELLIVVGGQDSASYLSNLRTEPFIPSTGNERDFPATIRSKLVFEMHFYNLVYVRPLWGRVPDRTACQWMRYLLESRNGFITEEGKPYTAPLWMGEFGLDVEKMYFRPDDPDTKWLLCLRDWMREKDLDWAYWVLNSRYYIRQGTKDYREDWGLVYNVSDAPAVQQKRQRLLSLEEPITVQVEDDVKNPRMLRFLQALMPARLGPGISAPVANSLP